MSTFQQKYQEIISEIPGSKVARILRNLKAEIGDRPLVLYGAGTMAKIVWAYCKEFGPPIACFCDSTKTGVYGPDRLPIVNMDILKRDFSEATVVISSLVANGEIHASLLQNGFAPERIVPYPTYDGSEIPDAGFYSRPLTAILHEFEPYLEGHRWAYDFYEDERSRKLVLDRMRMYLLIQFMQPNTTCQEYYESDFVSLAENEVFVDGGGFDGDSAEAFIGKMAEAGKNYSGIYTFEPSSTNYANAVQRLSRHPGVEVVQKGLWSSDSELKFFENNVNLYGSSFVHGSAEMTHTVPVASLDSFFKDKARSGLPTFIKMDIEGAEKEAILGAAGIIKSAKPKLAICAYHKPEDIYELPQTIMGIRDDYRFALRQHYAGPWQTILYAL